MIAERLGRHEEEKLADSSPVRPCTTLTDIETESPGLVVPERSRFPPQPTSAILNCAQPQYLPTSGRGGRRVRAQRHNHHSIATLRIQIARFLVQRLPCCPLCHAARQLHRVAADAFVGQ